MIFSLNEHLPLSVPGVEEELPILEIRRQKGLVSPIVSKRLKFPAFKVLKTWENKAQFRKCSVFTPWSSTAHLSPSSRVPWSPRAMRIRGAGPPSRWKGFTGAGKAERMLLSEDHVFVPPQAPPTRAWSLGKRLRHLLLSWLLRERKETVLLGGALTLPSSPASSFRATGCGVSLPPRAFGNHPGSGVWRPGDLD